MAKNKKSASVTLSIPAELDKTLSSIAEESGSTKAGLIKDTLMMSLPLMRSINEVKRSISHAAIEHGKKVMHEYVEEGGD